MRPIRCRWRRREMPPRREDDTCNSGLQAGGRCCLPERSVLSSSRCPPSRSNSPRRLPRPPPRPLPPGSPLIGRPNTEAAMKLAPVAPPPIPSSPEKLATVPGKLKLQKGFHIELYAGNVPNARSLRQGEKGTVFVGSRLQDKVHYITESGGKREVKVLVSGLYRPNGLAIKDGTLYLAG